MVNHGEAGGPLSSALDLDVASPPSRLASPPVGITVSRRCPNGDIALEEKVDKCGSGGAGPFGFDLYGTLMYKI